MGATTGNHSKVAPVQKVHASQGLKREETTGGGTSPDSSATPTPRGVLVASRRMSVLDELRVPYDVAVATSPDDDWGAIVGDAPARSLHWHVGPGNAARQLGARDPIARVSSLRRRSSRALRPASMANGAQTSRCLTTMARTCRRSGAAVTAERSCPSTRMRLSTTCDPSVTRRAGDPAPQCWGASLGAATTSRARSFHGPCRSRCGACSPRVRARRPFPRWPAETALHDLCDLVTGLVAEVGGGVVPCIAPWPAGYSWALVLTHDVETAKGRDAIDHLRRAEESEGLTSSWNLVPERYEVTDELVTHLRAAGCEVGVHGLRHDGHDLASLRTLQRRLPLMQMWALDAGMRSGSAPRQRTARLGVDADAGVRLRLFVPRIPTPTSRCQAAVARGCRSSTRIWSSSDHAAPGPHNVRAPAYRSRNLAREDRSAEKPRRYGVAHNAPDYMLEPARLRSYERFLQRLRS